MSLQIRNLEAGYGKKQVLRGVSLDVGAREVVALVGHNGAGKSTLLKSVFGALTVGNGSVSWDGVSIVGQSEAENLRKGIVYCPEGGRVFRTLSVMENLELAGFAADDPIRTRSNISKVHELFPVLQRKIHNRGGQLSGGERQMLAIGMSLVASPQLLMLDEPSGGLAPRLVEQVFDTIRAVVQQFNTSVLLVEQNINAAFRVSDRGYVLAMGEISDSGTPAELSQGDRLHRSFFGHEA
jgi:branched-chain amino acid transport system ATP-binding protein